jgi:fructose-1,6-bisphosphatase/sedoheptulose 1,7-bisphosphatase-like protein
MQFVSTSITNGWLITIMRRFGGATTVRSYVLMKKFLTMGRMKNVERKKSSEKTLSNGCCGFHSMRNACSQDWMS